MASRAWFWIGIAALFAPAAAFAALRTNPAIDPTLMSNGLHFWGVSGIALFAAAASIILIISAPTLRETRLLFLALAFMTIAGVFSVHGLTTPGFVVHKFHTSIAVSPWLSAVAGGGFAALSAATLPRPVERLIRRAGVAIFAWMTIAITIFIALSLSSRDWLDGVPTDDRNVQYALAALATALYAFAAWRFIEAYQFARLPSQAAMVACQVLLAQVPAIILWGQVWQASWWIYHALYAAAFTVLLAGWAIEVRRARSLSVIAEGLSMREALAQLNRGHDAHMLELVDAIEAKDVATLGHVRRVGAYALAIGKRLGLSAGELRSLALAAEMHDVGKIGVPDHILGKPGPLDDDERNEMQRHAPRGYEIAGRTKALAPVAAIIRAHHERLDGSGYPDALRGDEVPLMARIIAVADSYDAMTSQRPYRAPMPRAAAIAELRRVRAVELDARCIDALIASLEEQALAA